jgi:hypothetical protein
MALKCILGVDISVGGRGLGIAMRVRSWEDGLICLDLLVGHPLSDGVEQQYAQAWR